MTNETITGIKRLSDLIGGDNRWDVDITGGTISNVTITDTDISANQLTGTTLAPNVVSSSLTSVGTLANLTVTNPINGSVTTNANLTGAVTSVGNATSLGSFTSANLRGALTDETGSGSAVFGTSPTIATPTLTGDVIQDVVRTSGSSGVVVKNSGGTTVATLGSANTTNSLLAGALAVGGVITATAGQITFPATQNPSSNVNTLDDYEEGTWTPVYTYATAGDLSVAYSTQLGSYTKVGNLVTLSGRIVTTTHTYTTASGNMRITGLPFAAKNTANMRWHGVCNFSGITKAMVGLGNVDNTSDANKPISTATQTALNNRSYAVGTSGSASITIVTGGVANLIAISGHTFTIPEADFPIGATIQINGMSERVSGAGSANGGLSVDINGSKRYWILTGTGTQWQYQFTLYRESATSIRMMGGGSAQIQQGSFGSINTTSTTATVTAGGNVVCALSGWGTTAGDVIAYRFFKAILTR